MLTAPATADTRGMINAETLSQMRPDAYLVNVARGELVVESDLVAALQGRRLAGAGLDVFQVEPLPADSALREFNVVLGSHNGSNTRQGVERASQRAVDILLEELEKAEAGDPVRTEGRSGDRVSRRDRPGDHREAGATGAPGHRSGSVWLPPGFTRSPDRHGRYRRVALASQMSSLDAYAIGALVHNAAVQPIGAVGETSVADWIEALRVNVLAADVLAGAFRQSMATQNGSVVVVSSVHARATTGGITAYATTKAALEGWVRSAALDLGPDVRVNAIAPGAVDTAKLREGFERWGPDLAEPRRAVLCERTALGRIAEPTEIAEVVGFLIGGQSAFMTGSVLTIDGGASARLGSE